MTSRKEGDGDKSFCDSSTKGLEHRSMTDGKEVPDKIWICMTAFKSDPREKITYHQLKPWRWLWDRHILPSWAEAVWSQQSLWLFFLPCCQHPNNKNNELIDWLWILFYKHTINIQIWKKKIFIIVSISIPFTMKIINK